MELRVRTDTTEATNCEMRTKLADGMADTATLLMTMSDAEQHAYEMMAQKISPESLAALAPAVPSFSLHATHTPEEHVRTRSN